jgi:hypothetical protein
MAEISHGNESARPGHEERDVQIKPILVLGTGLIVITIGVLLLMYWAVDVLSARRAAQDVPPALLSSTLPPLAGPRLQITPALDLQKLYAEEDAVLSSYAWVDRAHGIVRIPIDRAMNLLIERGLPTRDTQPGGP